VPHAIDHIVILVRDLAHAESDYRRLGFTVTPGGEHTGGATHNALIAFADGTYFELIAFKEPNPPAEHRWGARLAQGEGLIDYAVRSSDVEADLAAIAARGLPTSGPIAMGRVRPDGQRIAWRIGSAGMPGRAEGQSALPFLIEDVTPRALRVPGDDATRHALGVTRVAGVRLVVADLGASAVALAALLGVEGHTAPSPFTGASTTMRFPTDTQWLELVQPTDPASALGQYLHARGEGPYEVLLGADDAAQSGSGRLLSLELAHGARIRVPQDTAGSPSESTQALS
jgi:hypothetical protein